MNETAPTSRFVTLVVWLICGLLIMAILARKCAYVPLDPSEFVISSAK